MVGLQPRSTVWPQLAITGVVASVQVNTCVQVVVLPHASVAVYVLVLDQLQPPVFTAAAKLDENDTGPQLSVAVGVPGAGIPVGLQPRSAPWGHEVITGGVVSVTLNVTEQVEEHPF